MKHMSISFKDFIRKVYEVISRHALRGMGVLLSVLRRLRERGIWPWPVKTRAEDVCGRVANEVAGLNENAETMSVGTSAEKKDSTAGESRRASAVSSQIRSLTRDARSYIHAHYDVRYNVLEGQAEIRERAGGATYRAVTPVVLNTLVLRLHEEGLPVWDRDVLRLLNSLEARQYHPLTDYLASLPRWDGVDRLAPLARRVSDDALWVSVFGVWMRGMVHQWLGVTEQDAERGNRANQLALILVSREQGLGKSSFCRLLLPPPLAALYTDKFELAGRQNLEFPLCRYALVNLDEFDRYGAQQMAKLKNLMQLGRMNVRRPHAVHFEQMQRTASFIGTSNTAELLTDPSGSRRFFCQEVAQAIDCTTAVDHDQLYAQILSQLAEGLPYYMDKPTEEAVQQHNRPYYRASALREAFLSLYSKVEGAEVASCSEWLTATDIYRHLQQHFGSHIINGSPAQLGRQLAFLGLEKRHAERGNEYRVKRV